jgi:hypothetical protein
MHNGSGFKAMQGPPYATVHGDMHNTASVLLRLMVSNHSSWRVLSNQPRPPNSLLPGGGLWPPSNGSEHPLPSLLHYTLQLPLVTSHTAGGVHTQAPSVLFHVASWGQMHTPVAESHAKLLGHTHFFKVASLQQQHRGRAADRRLHSSAAEHAMCTMLCQNAVEWHAIHLGKEALVGLPCQRSPGKAHSTWFLMPCQSCIAILSLHAKRIKNTLHAQAHDSVEYHSRLPPVCYGPAHQLTFSTPQSHDVPVQPAPSAHLQDGTSPGFTGTRLYSAPAPQLQLKVALLHSAPS